MPPQLASQVLGPTAYPAVATKSQLQKTLELRWGVEFPLANSRD